MTFHFMPNTKFYECLLEAGGLHLEHMEVPMLGAELELQLPAYTTATPDPRCIRDLSSWQRWILNPLNWVGDETHVLMDTSGVHYTEPQQELPRNSLYNKEIQSYYKISPTNYCCKCVNIYISVCV